MRLSLPLVLLLSSALPISGQPSLTLIGNYEVVNWFDLSDSSILDPSSKGEFGATTISPDGTKMCVIEEGAGSDAGIICFGLERNATDGTVVGITPPIGDGTPNNARVYEQGDLDTGFTTGPGGLKFISRYGEEEIIQVTVDFDSDPFPTIGLVGSFNPNGVNGVPGDSTYGLVFSPIVTDPGTGYDMLFAAAENGIYEFPLQPTTVGGITSYIPLADYQGVKKICNLAVDFPGDLRIIPSGVNYQDLLFGDFDNGNVNIIELDDSGYCFDATTGTPYDGANTVADPKITTIVDSDAEPTGLTFDPKTGDFFVSFYDEPFVAQIRGFPPGFDTELVLGLTLDAWNILNGYATRRRKTRQLAKSPVATCGVPLESACSCQLCEGETGCNKIKIKTGPKELCVASAALKNVKRGWEGFDAAGENSCILSDCVDITSDPDLKVGVSAAGSVPDAQTMIENPELVTSAIATVFDTSSVEFRTSIQTGELNADLSQAVTKIETAVDAIAAAASEGASAEVQAEIEALRLQIKSGTRLLKCVGSPIACL